MQISKRDVALHQLNVAIRLFLAGDYLASLTLAGAAEEILGNLSRRAGKPVAVEYIVDYHCRETNSVLSNDERKSLIALLNQGRNMAKHANNPDETHFEVEQIYPLQMIMRAMPMAVNLGVQPTKEGLAMVEWIRAHPEAFK